MSITIAVERERIPGLLEILGEAETHFQADVEAIRDHYDAASPMARMKMAQSLKRQEAKLEALRAHIKQLRGAC